MVPGSQMDRESVRPVSRRRLAKAVVAALGVAGFAGAGLSGALARHSDGWDDDWVMGTSGSGASGGSGGSGWDDDWVFPSSGGSGWDDD